MSGGSYDYAYVRLNEFADSLKEKGACDAASPLMRRAFAEHCRKVAQAMRACEWNDSFDGDSRETQLISELVSPQPINKLVMSDLETLIEGAETLLRGVRKMADEMEGKGS